MKQDICTIPVSEVFEPKDGCPLCRLQTMLEERMVDYITGAAMMEPDVREDTNRTGFCYRHFSMMAKRRKRLSVALILQSHLAEVERSEFGSRIPKEDDCFVCREIEWGMSHMLVTIFKMYEEEVEFRELFAGQTGLCRLHRRRLLADGRRKLSRKRYGKFSRECDGLCEKSLREIRQEIDRFCHMFDYRSRGSDEDFASCRDSIERAVEWLTTHLPEGSEAEK